MKVIKRSNKMAKSRPEGGWEIRVFHRKAIGKRNPRYLLKCGCCNEQLEIVYGGGSLEINGVMGSVEDWREILLPLLKVHARRAKIQKHRSAIVPQDTNNRRIRQSRVASGRRRGTAG